MKARRAPDPPSDGLAAELAAAIDDLPSFIRSPIFLPTERVPAADAIRGLAHVRDLYEYDLDLVHRPRLRALKAARSARRCFIIGNGPSLARTDLRQLESEVTFATNAFFLKMAELDWTPTYYVVEDHLVGEDRAEDLAALTGTTKLFPASLAYAIRPDEHTIFFDHRPRPSFPDGYDFSFEADIGTYTGGTVTFTCMQLAAYLGFQEIYLIGVDADYSIPADAALSGSGQVREIDMRSDDPNHFHPDYFGKGKRWHEPNVDVMLGAYAEARRATEARGVSIVNATVGGKLEVFPRIDYGMLFREAPAERLLLIDHTPIGNGTATGEVKAAILGNWPKDLLMQLYDVGAGKLRVAGGPVEVAEGEDVVGPIEAFDPDLILYRPVPRTDALHATAMGLITRTNLPLALWIVDDWPVAFAHEDPVRAGRLEADLRWLVGHADARFSISSAMSAAFHERYGRPFVPIANGIDPADWPAARLRPTSHVTVRYAGSLAENMTQASVALVARVVERLAAGGLDISLEIKTHQHWHATNADWLAGLEHTSVTTSDLPAAEYRRWLAEADILLIAYNFDDRSRDYIRYSLANKLPECLASGAPILAVGPDDIATFAALEELDVGARVAEADEEVIGQALRRLAASPEMRFELARRAQEVASSLFGVRGVQQAFEAGVNRVAVAHRAGTYPRDLHAHVDETAVVASLLAERRGPEHVMLDVGAHSGSSAAHFDRLDWTVHCFEPHPERRETLAVRFGERANVRIDPRALGDTRATGVPLFDSAESSGISTLAPFHASHRTAAMVDVTTIDEVTAEIPLLTVDFLKIDVEGLDLAVLRGVPWDRLRPDVIECEFEDAKTLALGHSWRDIAELLTGHGYAVYVSEWHPVIRYGTRHDWRRVAPFSPHLDVHPAAWGNLVAFRADPGWPAVRRAFDQHLDRSATRPVPTPAPKRRAETSRSAPVPSRRAAEPGRLEPRSVERSRVEPRDRGDAAPRRRPFYAPLARAIKRRTPGLYAMLRLARRAVAHGWRRRRFTVPLAILLAAWLLLGFVPAFAPAAELIWGAAAVATIGLATWYAIARVYESTLAVPREVARLRRGQKAQRRQLTQAHERIRRLEQQLADGTRRNARLAQRLGQLEASGGEEDGSDGAAGRADANALPITEKR